MSDTEQGSEYAQRPRRRIGRLIGAAVVFWLLAFLVPQFLWSLRPRWRNIVSSPTTTSPTIALALRIPVGWECRQEQGLPSDYIELNLRRKPQTGLARWWNEHVLRIHDEQSDFRIVLFVTRSLPLRFADPDEYIDERTKAYQRMRLPPSYQQTLRTFKHPLGPALERTAVFRGSGPAPYPGIKWFETSEIAVRKHPSHEFVAIRASCIAVNAAPSFMQATRDAIVRSIRVVQK